MVLQDKLKEKKQVMVDALTTTLNAMHKGGCVQLQDVIEGRKFIFLHCYTIPTITFLTFLISLFVLLGNYGMHFFFGKRFHHPVRTDKTASCECDAQMLNLLPKIKFL